MLHDSFRWLCMDDSKQVQQKTFEEYRKRLHHQRLGGPARPYQINGRKGVVNQRKRHKKRKPCEKVTDQLFRTLHLYNLKHWL